MPSPAAGKGDTPRTPTKLGRKPQQSGAPKLGKKTSQADAPETDSPNLPQRPSDETLREKAADAPENVEDTKGQAEDDAEEATDDAQGKVSQADDGLEQAEPKPIDDAEEKTKDAKGTAEEKAKDAKSTAEETADDAEDEAEETDDGATQKAGDEGEEDVDDEEEAETQDNTEDDATDTASTAQKKGSGSLSGARDLAGRASNLAGKASEDPKGAAEDAGEDAQSTAEDAKSTTEDAAEEGKASAEDAKSTAEDAAEGGKASAEDATEEGKDSAEDATEEGKASAEDATEEGKASAEDATEEGKASAEDAAEGAKDSAEDATEGTEEKTDGVKDSVEDGTGEDAPGTPDLGVLKGLEVDDEGLVKDKDGNALGRLVEGDAEDLAGYAIGENGEILDDDGDLVGRCELLPETAQQQLKDAQAEGEKKMPPLSILKGLSSDRAGQILNEDGDFVGHLVEGDPTKIEGLEFDENGEIYDDDGNLLARAELHPDAAELVDQDDDEEGEEGEGDAADGVDDKAADATDAAEDAADGDAPADIEDELPGVDALEGMEVNSQGEVLNDDGEVVGNLAEGNIDDVKGLSVNDQGEVVDADGNVLGKVELADGAAEKLKEAAQGALDVRILEGLKVNKKGKVLDAEGEEIGELKDGDVKDCAGKTVNEKGEVVDKDGEVVGKVDVVSGEAAFEAMKDLKERLGDSEPEIKEVEVFPELNTLEGLKVNKKGQVLNEDGEPIGELEEGDAEECAGKKVNDKGEVLDKDGKVIGKVKTIPQIVEQKVGEEEEDEEPEVKEVEITPELNILEGLKVNKKGQVLNEDGEPIGELEEGDAEECAGKKVNEKGEVLDKDGKVIGKVKTIPQIVEQKVGEEEEQEGEEEEEEDNEEPEVEEVEITPELNVLEGLKVNKKGQVLNEDGETIGELEEGDIEECAGKKINEKGEVLDKDGNVIGKVKTLPQLVEQKVGEAEDAQEGAEAAAENAEEAAEDAEEAAEDAEDDGDDLPPLSILEGLSVNKSGKIIDANGNIVGELIEGDAKKLSKAGITSDAEGQFWDNKGKVIGRAQTVPQEESEEESPFAGLEGLKVVKGGFVEDENGNRVGQVVDGDAKKLVGRTVDEDGDILDKKGSVVGHAERYDEPEEEVPEVEYIDLSELEGLTVNKQGNVIGNDGVPVARLVEGNPKELAGRKLDGEGQIWNDSGKVVGRVELIPPEEREAKPEGPFAGLQGLRVIPDGLVADEDENVVGQVVEGNAKRLIGNAVDEDGDILDKYGNVKGHAEPIEDEEEIPDDLSVLDGLTLNKQGYLVDSNGTPIGQLVEGKLDDLVGRKSDGEGQIHNDTGKVVGRCELIPENQRVTRKEGPFAGLEGLHVVKDGFVEDAESNRVGQITEGDPKKLIGNKVDEDGDIIDKYGNVKGHAEPWEEEEEVEADLSALAGCTVNKAGNVVNDSGTILGRVSEGDPSTMIGKKVDGKGQIWDNAGNVIGRAELVADANSGPEGPFAGFDNNQIQKDGTVTNEAGDIIGRVIEGDIKKLVGHKVDEDGDINDKNGNVIGKAERWEPEEKERRINPMSGMHVNKDGEVRDESGDLIGRLTAGDLGHCAGLEIDDNGYVIDNDGNKVGEVTLLENIQEEDDGELTEEEQKRKEDAELADKMANICQQTLERVQPVCKQITEYIEQADRTPRDELDEEELVNNVKPLIEEAGRILQECNGSLRGLDPDGRIAAQAKGRQQTKEATPEEYRLADLLKEITTSVVTTIDNAKKKIADMPHAKKKLNPLWALMTEPLFQIIAAVGLLLTGVLNLVGKLLNGLGLGGLVNGLLGGLGINKLLSGLGLGSLSDMMGGGKKKGEKKKGGGVSNIPIVGGLLGGGK